MADHTPTGPVELGAKMDYEEHERTYTLFLGLAKYGSLVTGALLIAMAFSFFTSGRLLLRAWCSSSSSARCGGFILR